MIEKDRSLRVSFKAFNVEEPNADGKIYSKECLENIKEQVAQRRAYPIVKNGGNASADDIWGEFIDIKVDDEGVVEGTLKFHDFELNKIKQETVDAYLHCLKNGYADCSMGGHGVINSNKKVTNFVPHYVSMNPAQTEFIVKEEE